VSFLDDLVNDAAAAIESEDSITYFQNRGIGVSSLKKCRVGYIDSPYVRVNDSSHSSDCDEAKCEFCKFRKWFYFKPDYEKCRFNNSIIFPLTDFKNRVTGITIRSIKEKKFESYVLDRDNNAILFKPDSAVRKTWDLKQIWITEGPVDGLSLVEASVDNVMSIMTNNMSRNQIRWLRRLSEDYILALDHDEAGRLGFDNAKERLGDLNVKKFSWNNHLDCKDLNDLLRKVGVSQLRYMVSQCL